MNEVCNVKQANDGIYSKNHLAMKVAAIDRDENIFKITEEND